MAGLFAGTARPVLLAAARSGGLRRAMQRSPATRGLVRRFVAGETLDTALSGVAALRDSGRLVTVDYLGEDIADIAGVRATVAGYLELLDALGRRPDTAHRGVRLLEVSVKLSALGRAVAGDGEQIALHNAGTICERARRVGVWVTIDAEDHTGADSTLAIVTQLRADFDWLGVVVQAQLRRAEGDCRDLAAAGARVRLCKGAYREPSSVAYQHRADVTDSYLRCARVLLAGAGYPMLASHDPDLISAIPGMAARYRRGPDDFEYQMLYGVRDGEQRRLAAGGNRVRVYLPFGRQWYGYFIRRLAERPANLAFFLRALAERRAAPGSVTGKAAMKPEGVSSQRISRLQRRGPGSRRAPARPGVGAAVDGGESSEETHRGF